MSFALDLTAFSKLTSKKMETVVKKSFIGLSSDVIQDTPVLTGRLRNNWFPNINSFSGKTTDSVDKSGATATTRVATTTNTYKLGDTLTLTNNLDYAIPIEFYSWSKKAPRGMVEVNVTRWQKWVDKEARKLR
jgi:hypothetical protein